MKKLEKLKVPASLSAAVVARTSNSIAPMPTATPPVLNLNKETVTIFINNYGPINGPMTQPQNNLVPPSGKYICNNSVSNDNHYRVCATPEQWSSGIGNWCIETDGFTLWM